MSKRCTMREIRCLKDRTTFLFALLMAFGRTVNSASPPVQSLRRSSIDLGTKLQSRRQQVSRKVQQRQQDEVSAYYRTNDSKILGQPNYMAAIGNPLKGLVGFGPREYLNQILPDNVPSAIEKYNLGLNDIMIGDNQFNWTMFDQLVEASASRKMHSVFSIYVHWPGQPLLLPPHLTDLPLYDTQGHGQSPDYGNPRLLLALDQFIVAWGQHIDGDTRVAAVHVGLLGFWGEGHTYPDIALVPESSTQAVAQWYRNAFKSTQVQARYPGPSAEGLGLFDASLAYSTLDGEANGGVDVDWFMYPQIVRANQQNSWTNFIMGGETRPELQEIIFQDWYPSGTERKQNLRDCIDALHISYVVHQDAFKKGGYTGDVLNEANEIHAYMGYSFYVSEIAASVALPPTGSNATVIDVAVSITQQGIAPFYYDLNLVFECGKGIMKLSLPGVNEIIERGTSKTFMFPNIPATVECLDQIQLSLQSSYAYPDRPIKFGQGTDGLVIFGIPVPLSSTATENRIMPWWRLFSSTLYSMIQKLFRGILGMFS